MKNEEIVIETSKTKVLGLIGLSVLFVFLGVWMVFYAPKVNVEFLNNEILRTSTGILSIVIFGITGILFSKKLIGNKYGIMISNEGVYDNSTSVNSGLIKWSNIERIEQRKVLHQRFIQIIVDNPEHFIEKHTNILTRKSVESTFKKYGSPIQISTNALKIGFEELFDVLGSELRERK